MRNLVPIVGISLGIVGNAWQDRSTSSSIAFQLVGDDPEWLLALTAQQSAKEPPGCTLVRGCANARGRITWCNVAATAVEPAQVAHHP
jgi:hypothetical protein